MWRDELRGVRNARPADEGDAPSTGGARASTDAAAAEAVKKRKKIKKTNAKCDKWIAALDERQDEVSDDASTDCPGTDNDSVAEMSSDVPVPASAALDEPDSEDEWAKMERKRVADELLWERNPMQTFVPLQQPRHSNLMHPRYVTGSGTHTRKRSVVLSTS